ncbi:MAG: hypothetical protein K5905_14135 [Roseibium sp.]|uniref:hypothetical protein n=1 Tax=Roseibium sp. TaxID=1936156 RepID=UPI002639C48A|nr:hypothetical protein [Roseibium sp.]MCV0426603.1 hypothetical protein [Roseibium sp.]
MVCLTVMYGFITGFLENPFFLVLSVLPFVLGLTRKGILLGVFSCCVLAVIWGVSVAIERNSYGFSTSLVESGLMLWAVFLFTCLLFLLARSAIAIWDRVLKAS